MQVACGTAFTSGRAVASQRAFFSLSPSVDAFTSGRASHVYWFFASCVFLGQTFVRSPLAAIKGHRNMFFCFSPNVDALASGRASHVYLVILFLCSFGSKLFVRSPLATIKMALQVIVFILPAETVATCYNTISYGSHMSLSVSSWVSS